MIDIFCVTLQAIMTKLLDNYIFNERMRYESHQLVYCYSVEEEPIQIRGFLGVAVLCARLINNEEGERREIPLDIENKQKQEKIFTRYDNEVVNDDWGFLDMEVNLLNDAFIQLTVSEKDISDICPNLRQLTIAMSMLKAYMHRLVVEVYGEHIWEAEKWTMPFGLWLFNAGLTETLRQRYFSIDWTDPVMVNALTESLNQAIKPSYFFKGEDANDIMRRYWEWLWDNARKQAAETPDAEMQLAEIKELILSNETDEHFFEDDLRELPTDIQRLFRQWTTRWTTFLTDKLASTAQNSFPEQQRQTRVEQVLFPDTTLTCPQPRKYTQVRDYIHDRSLYDEAFRDYYESHFLNDFCEQLTLMFGWYVNPNSLGKNLKRKKK